jgi:hypothetical protein
LIIPAISSSDELVSSNDAACSLAPSANDWLASDTWPAADDVCAAPADNASATPRIGLVIDRVKYVAKPIPTAKAIPKPTIIVVDAADNATAAVADISPLVCVLFSADDFASCKTISATLLRCAPKASRFCQFDRNIAIADS